MQEAIRSALVGRGLDEVLWRVAILDAWEEVASGRCQSNAAPLLEKSDIKECGLLVIGVSSSSWRHELSFMDIAGALNRALGVRAIRRVRFELT